MTDYIKYLKLNNTSYDFQGKIFDGQWVVKNVTISTATSVASRTHNLGTTGTSPLNYLPADSYDYEVLFRLATDYKSSSSMLLFGTSSDLYNGTANRATLYVTSNSTLACINCIFPVRISTNRIMYSRIYNGAANVATIKALAYRRLGTNT